uniref:Uncharacterized protein n=1 Tax=Mycena chlorophos TaxID=658473 RepID=A0ABQ0L1R3_MYCCL|nr:predicted protein [Mycena chlorophos]
MGGCIQADYQSAAREGHQLPGRGMAVEGPSRAQSAAGQTRRQSHAFILLPYFHVPLLGSPRLTLTAHAPGQPRLAPRQLRTTYRMLSKRTQVGSARASPKCHITQTARSNPRTYTTTIPRRTHPEIAAPGPLLLTAAIHLLCGAVVVVYPDCYAHREIPSGFVCGIAMPTCLARHAPRIRRKPPRTPRIPPLDDIFVWGCEGSRWPRPRHTCWPGTEVSDGSTRPFCIAARDAYRALDGRRLVALLFKPRAYHQQAHSQPALPPASCPGVAFPCTRTAVTTERASGGLGLSESSTASFVPSSTGDTFFELRLHPYPIPLATSPLPSPYPILPIFPTFALRTSLPILSPALASPSSWSLSPSPPPFPTYDLTILRTTLDGGSKPLPSRDGLDASGTVSDAGALWVRGFMLMWTLLVQACAPRHLALKPPNVQCSAGRHGPVRHETWICQRLVASASIQHRFHPFSSTSTASAGLLWHRRCSDCEVT